MERSRAVIQLVSLITTMSKVVRGYHSAQKFRSKPPLYFIALNVRIPCQDSFVIFVIFCSDPPVSVAGRKRFPTNYYFISVNKAGFGWTCGVCFMEIFVFAGNRNSFRELFWVSTYVIFRVDICVAINPLETGFLFAKYVLHLSISPRL